MLTERDRIILAAVIERHLVTAQPVSSRELCAAYGFPFSSATVRNCMVRLEEEGLLSHPYTSAGKLPTLHAYQLFIEALKPRGWAEDPTLAGIRSEILERVRAADQLLQLSARVLAVASRLLAVTWLPNAEVDRLRGIRLFRLASQRLLLTVETVSGHAYHEAFDPETPVHAGLPERVMTLINQAGRGLSPAELERLARADWPGLDRQLLPLLRHALRKTGASLAGAAREQVTVEGVANLIQQPEFNSLPAARQLIALLDQREILIHSLDAPGIAAGEARVVFDPDGAEGALPSLACVTEQVTFGPGRFARIGVLGPRRMPYARIIPLVMITAQTLQQVAAGTQRPTTLDEGGETHVL